MRMTTNSCPCCGNPLLRHVRHQGVYWFCQSCWQEVPLLCSNQSHSSLHGRTGKRPVSANLR
jgi:uncharacterized Zn finger protein (UPF0148 family)